MTDLPKCPFCGAQLIWCDSVADEDGDYHECDHALCPVCDMDFTLVSGAIRNVETFEEGKELVANALRKRESSAEKT